MRISSIAVLAYQYIGGDWTYFGALRNVDDNAEIVPTQDFDSVTATSQSTNMTVFEIIDGNQQFGIVYPGPAS